MSGRLLVEVDRATKLGIQDDLEFLHPLFALFCGGGEVGELRYDVGLVSFETFEGSGLGEVKERFADFVSGQDFKIEVQKSGMRAYMTI